MEAAKRIDDPTTTRTYSQRLVELAGSADGERAELTAAKQLLARN
jgi:hypothetical protein